MHPAGTSVKVTDASYSVHLKEELDLGKQESSSALKSVCLTACQTPDINIITLTQVTKLRLDRVCAAMLCTVIKQHNSNEVQARVYSS